jgi:hypothetical protein
MSYEKVMAFWSFGQTSKKDYRVGMWHNQWLTRGNTNMTHSSMDMTGGSMDADMECWLYYTDVDMTCWPRCTDASMTCW